MTFEAFGTLTDLDLAIFEASIGFGLPADYRRFLIKTNGGIFREAAIYVEELESEIPLDLMFGLKLQAAFDLVAVNREFGDEVPESHLIIGRDPGGGDFAMGATGEIYWYDNDCYFPSSTGEKISYRLATSFTEWMTKVGLSC